MFRAPWRVSALIVVSSIVCLVACSSSDKPGDAPSTQTSSPAPSPSPSTAGPADSARAAALAAYRGYLAAWVAAARTSNPNDPALLRYADGAALRTVVGSLAANRAAGKVSRGTIVPAPKVVALSPSTRPTSATIRDCADASHWLLYRKSGELWNDDPGGRHDVNAVVHSTAAGWKVTSIAIGGVGSC